MPFRSEHQCQSGSSALAAIALVVPFGIVQFARVHGISRLYLLLLSDIRFSFCNDVLVHRDILRTWLGVVYVWKAYRIKSGWRKGIG